MNFRMKTDAKKEKYLDTTGMAISALCAMHCVVLPLLLGALVTSGAGVAVAAWKGNEWIEWTILGLSLIFGLISLLPSYFRRHNRPACLCLFSCGMLSILASRLTGTAMESSLLLLGAVLNISAHATNRYFCACCGQCNQTTLD